GPPSKIPGSFALLAARRNKAPCFRGAAGSPPERAPERNRSNRPSFWPRRTPDRKPIELRRQKIESASLFRAPSPPRSPPSDRFGLHSKFLRRKEDRPAPRHLQPEGPGLSRAKQAGDDKSVKRSHAAKPAPPHRGDSGSKIAQRAAAVFSPSL